MTSTNTTAVQRTREQAIAAMNRGHGHLREGTQESATAALRCYEEAITLLRSIPLPHPPDATNSLAAAWMNRGQLLHRLHGRERAQEAIGSFDEAVALLREVHTAVAQTPGDAATWIRRNLAGSLLNRACVALDVENWIQARDDASESLGFTRAEKSDAPPEFPDAEIALKSTRALCDALGQLMTTAASPHEQSAIVERIGELADDALAAFRAWVATPRGPFVIPAAVRVFRIGARAYALHQPHFLCEFIRDWLEPVPAEHRPGWNAVALEVLAFAEHMLARPRHHFADDPGTERRLAALAEIRELGASLQPAPTPTDG
ncbi:hypothetical protein ASA1KI_31850 [Opitutales bacterium ASA1]|uniref:hypothetical protein n=1 Tax=Congregicoccus parvus TaxID=3081749 RepID=UPI002B2EF17A|nr:hypothetical protein ASA1KI_31850 [Opitutales bacterium ASA1]